MNGLLVNSPHKDNNLSEYTAFTWMVKPEFGTSHIASYCKSVNFNYILILVVGKAYKKSVYRRRE